MNPVIISAVAGVIFAPHAAETMTTDEVYQAAAAYAQVELDEVLRAFETKHLVRLSLNGQTTQATLSGKIAFEDGSLAALVLGPRYIVEQFGHAVVHIIVEGGQGESGATGFFSTEFDGYIVTASHVIRDREVLRVEDREGNIISQGPHEVIVGPRDLDIALIVCQKPDGIRPLQIEWRPEMIEPLNEVLILGFPPFANHYPALFHTAATVHATPLDYRRRNKLVISSITRPGCSGGPVISLGGFVVGIVEQENNLEQFNANHTFYTATAARHVSEIPLPNSEFT